MSSRQHIKHPRSRNRNTQVRMQSLWTAFETYLGYKARHERHDGWIAPKLPNEHDHLFHGYTITRILSQYIVDEAVRNKSWREK